MLGETRVNTNAESERCSQEREEGAREREFFKKARLGVDREMKMNEMRRKKRV